MKTEAVYPPRPPAGDWTDAAACKGAVSGPGEQAERIDNLEALVDMLDRLLAHYRTGGRPSGTLLDRIAECRRRRSALSGGDR